MGLFPIVLFSITGPVVVLLVAFRVWRQFWVESVGTITQVKLSRRVDEDQKRIRIFEIYYAFRVQSLVFAGKDEIRVDVQYHLEDDEIKKLTLEYGVGDPVRVYHARSRPGFNSLRRSMQLDRVLYAIGLLLFLILGYYLYAKVIVFSIEHDEVRRSHRISILHQEGTSRRDDNFT